LAIARELAELRRSDHEEERLRIERERWETEQEERRNEELEKLKRQVVGAEAHARFLFAEAKRQYKAKVKAGTLSPEEEANFQAIFAIFAKVDHSQEALTPRTAPFVGNQTGSNPIQPNQTNANKT
jgi:hypothetical protein